VIEGDGLCLSAGTTLLGQRGEEKAVVVRRENTASAKERCMVLPRYSRLAELPKLEKGDGDELS
jgi:hypothetical protein